jgi:hypothetical protein
VSKNVKKTLMVFVMVPVMFGLFGGCGMFKKVWNIVQPVNEITQFYAALHELGLVGDVTTNDTTE